MGNNFLAESKQESWDNVLNQTATSDTIVLQFLVGQLDLDYLSASYKPEEQEKCISTLISSLLGTSISALRDLLSSNKIAHEISAANIPQFSNFATAAIYLPELLLNSHTQLTYREMGYALFSETKSDGAADKYGQNHGSLAVQLGLATTIKACRKSAFCATPLTAEYCKLEHSSKMELLQRLCFRIPIIRVASISDAPAKLIDEYLLKALAKSTYIRRKSNVLEVMAFALGE